MLKHSREWEGKKMSASAGSASGARSKSKEKEQTNEIQEQDRYKFVLEEARTVLPGIQALFGFQLITVFNPRFNDMVPVDQNLYWIALLLLSVAMCLLMTPAAYDRQTKCHRDPKHFEHVATFMITCALFPFMTALAIDSYIVNREMFKAENLALATGVTTFIIFGVLWYGFPLYMNATHKFEKHKSNKT